MEIAIFKTDNRRSDSIDHFMEFYYMLRMTHLASDLLEKGLSPQQIIDAAARAIRAAESSGLDTSQHFRPVFSGMEQEIIQDCKLSHLAYGLVLMNADEEISAVGEFQVSVLQKLLRS